MVHAGLDHRRLMLRHQPQQRQRRADVVVEVPLRAQGVVPLREHRGDHLLGGGLSGGAGDLYHGDVIQPPVPGCQSAQSQGSVLHPDIEPAGQQGLRHTVAQAAGSPGGQGRVDVVMPVEPGSYQGDEQVAGGDMAAVAGDAGDGVAAGLKEGPAYGTADVRRRQGPHARPPLRRARDSSTMRWHRSP